MLRPKLEANWRRLNKLKHDRHSPHKRHMGSLIILLIPRFLTIGKIFDAALQAKFLHLGSAFEFQIKLQTLPLAELDNASFAFALSSSNLYPDLTKYSPFSTNLHIKQSDELVTQRLIALMAKVVSVEKRLLQKILSRTLYQHWFNKNHQWFSVAFLKLNPNCRHRLSKNRHGKSFSTSAFI